jgi:hypothetical protein
MSSRLASSSQVISPPRGGGAVKGIGEVFQPNPFAGTADSSVPIATSAGLGGFDPQIALQFSNGNGPFGLGWQPSLASAARRIRACRDTATRVCLNEGGE